MEQSYVSVLTNDSYAYGILMIAQSLKNTNSQYPLHVLINNQVSEPIKELLVQAGVTYQIVEDIILPEKFYEKNRKISPRLAATWKYCWTKFNIFNLTQFKKIVFLDADVLILKNLDHLFEKPHMTAALDGEYFNIWPGDDHFNGGCLIIEPSKDEFENILKFVDNLKITDLRDDQLFADQEVLNLYYKDWPQKKELHLNKYYNVFAPYIQTEQVEDLKENAYFIHYIGRKPWIKWIKNPLEKYDEYFYTLGTEVINSSLSMINEEEVKAKNILTVYAICKNEIDNVKKWVKCFSQADYVCILDTGSTDGTWELLQKLTKKYKNLIIDQKIIDPWRFDTARNESLKLVPKETNIFFMVDLDEIIKEDNWVTEIKRAWSPTFSRGMYQYHRDVDENDKVLRTILEFRIHNRDWNHYKNIVHEAIYNEAEEKMFLIEYCTPINIQVWHYPKKNKITNYLHLCEECLKENPDDDIMKLQLAIECEIAKEFDYSDKIFFELISKPTKLQNFELSRCYTGLATSALRKEQIQKAIFLFAEGRLACPQFVDNYLIPAQTLYENGNYNESIELIKSAFKYCDQSFWCSINDIHSFIGYYYLGINYIQIEDYIPALGNLSVAYYLSGNEEIKNIINNIIQKGILKGAE